MDFDCGILIASELHIRRGSRKCAAFPVFAMRRERRPMRYLPLSEKQSEAMLWWGRPGRGHYDGVICDGAVRSGKTMALSVGFMLWSMAAFDGGVFALCGKTIESLRRNVTSLLPRWLEGLMEFQESRQENKLTVRCCGKTNVYYIFGGQNESSYSHIQGITLCGVLLDEVALMPRSFVEQAVARCSVTGSRLFFSCNPESPGHWFYQEWIQKAESRRCRYLHFTMDDNPSLSPVIRARYERMYTGLFYRRYVLGQWCMAQGLVYDFQEADMVSDKLPAGPVSYYISIDYGTRNPCSMGLWAVSRRTGQALRRQEYYYDSRSTQRQKTDEEYYQALEALAGDRDISAVIVDPSALSFITTIRRHGRFRVKKAQNDVLTGIRTVSGFLQSGQIRIHPDCKAALREFSLYRWEEAGEDRPVKENDHAMDDIRYFAMTVLRRR